MDERGDEPSVAARCDRNAVERAAGSRGSCEELVPQRVAHGAGDRGAALLKAHGAAPVRRA